jgi:hypothetical protein
MLLGLVRNVPIAEYAMGNGFRQEDEKETFT